MNGVIVMDKPEGFTSFDVVALMRGVCRERKIGHTGTLDPMATGVLPLLLGAATRALPFLQDTDKEYEAGFRLGFATDTQDRTGKTVAESGRRATRTQLESVLPHFRGNIFQTPPMYSAVSVDGHRLYELARQGMEVERAKRPVTVFRLELVEFDEASQSGRLMISCSKGTYIRTLCADIGEELSTYGIMTALRRTRASGFTLDGAVTPEEAKLLAAHGLLAEHIHPIESLFAGVPAVYVSAAQTIRVSNGGALDLERTSLRGMNPAQGSRYRILSPEDTFLALGEVRDGELAILRLFAQAASRG